MRILFIELYSTLLLLKLLLILIMNAHQKLIIKSCPALKANQSILPKLLVTFNVQIQTLRMEPLITIITSAHKLTSKWLLTHTITPVIKSLYITQRRCIIILHFLALKKLCLILIKKLQFFDHRSKDLFNSL